MKRILIFLDLFLIIPFLIIPEESVLISGKILDVLIFRKESSINFAYSIFVIIFCFLFSLARKNNKSASFYQPRKTLIINFLILFCSILMIFQASVGAPQEVQEVVNPYLSYVASLVFSAGVGYAMADLAFFFLSHRS